MPIRGSVIADRSKEWKYWTKYYEDKGCSYNKVLKLVYKKMGRK
jgi:hypothetical protein